MTLRAVETDAVRGLKGPPYKVGPRCSNPNCSKEAGHAHHIVRRSQVGKFPWVEVDGVDYPNLCGLCVACHEDITGREGLGHKAAILLHEGQWWWCLLRRPDDGVRPLRPPDDYIRVAPLDPHPPTLEQASAPRPHPVSGSDVCPTCGQHKRRRAGEPRPSIRRRRATWRVRVPADEQEDGAFVLDTLVDDLALVLGYDGDNARYYVLVPCLAFAQLNRAQFAREIEGLAK